MQYRLNLTLAGTSKTACIIVPASMNLEDLTIRIQKALHLPFCDDGWHTYRAFGRVYMPDRNIYAEQEMRWEGDLTHCRIYPSERPRLSRIFTVLGSDLRYEQHYFSGDYRVRCVLAERIAD